MDTAGAADSADNASDSVNPDNTGGATTAVNPDNAGDNAGSGDGMDGTDADAVLEVPVRRIDPGLPLPAYACLGDAGIDLMARCDVVLEPAGGRRLVPTGIAVAVPRGYAGFVLPRSGLALHHGVTCLNSPGIIDSGYRGELKVLLVNTDPSEAFEIRRGERIAQLVVRSVENVRLVEAASLGASTRGEEGFGSTGR